MHEDPDADARRDYAGALKAAFQRSGMTQESLSRGTLFSKAAVSRYFSGQRLAGQDFVDALVGFLDQHGHPLGVEEVEILKELRRNAQASGSVSARLERTEDMLERLRERLAETQEESKATVEAVVAETAAQLSELEVQLQDISQEVTKERERAEAAEAERDVLRAKDAEKTRRLEEASQFIQSLNSENANNLEEIRRLRREIVVLRGQVDNLSAEEAVPELSTQVPSVLASAPGTPSRSGRGAGSVAAPGEVEGPADEATPATDYVDSPMLDEMLAAGLTAIFWTALMQAFFYLTAAAYAESWRAQEYSAILLFLASGSGILIFTPIAFIGFSAFTQKRIAQHVGERSRFLDFTEYAQLSLTPASLISGIVIQTATPYKGPGHAWMKIFFHVYWWTW